MSSDPRTTLTLHNPADAATNVPVTVGVPLPRGAVHDIAALRLFAPDGQPAQLQRETLSRWSDGSIHWALLDFLAPSVPSGPSEWILESNSLRHSVAPSLSPSASPTAPLSNSPSSASAPPVRLSIHNDRFDLTDTDGGLLATLAFPLRTADGQTVSPALDDSHWLTTGPVRSTLAVDGSFPGLDLEFHTRISVFAGAGLVRLETRLRNPQRAAHRGGLWDLDDPNAILFRSFGVGVSVVPGPRGDARNADHLVTERRIAWSTTPDDPVHVTRGGVEITQHGSGGPHWNSPTHLDRNGDVSPERRGATVEVTAALSAVDQDAETHGAPTELLRASPLVALETGAVACAVAVPEFWQQFPKSLRADAQGVFVGLFPEVGDTVHELQPGEQKTHTVWLQLSDSPPRSTVAPSSPTLDWVRRPIRVSLPPAWHAVAKCPSFVSPSAHDVDPHLADFLRGALSDELNLAARRDRIDEYGWRNFGDLPADHEQEHYAGREPVVSHYNNQFDVLFGAIVQLGRTGDPGWHELLDPLARHVVDIDLYHTRRDRAAYNGGLFWHTDHYRAAGLCTHRTYSRTNQPEGKPYGGGPSCEHNYTTGLLHYYWMTGNPDARDAVLSLAHWVLAMDDGRNTVLGLVDAGPTGLATSTADSEYHGPGRGAGNSLNALTDAWLLTHDARWLDAAAAIVRRVVHPKQDIDALNLLHAESRWSYTVFLVALAKWLDVKAEAGQVDADYAYGQASLRHYARWMDQNERPYFDHPEQLEYPTATWAAQELRKANVLRLAARHVDEPERTRFLQRGADLARRAWSDLERFDNRFVARCLSILMTEGAREAWLMTDPPPAPRGVTPTDWPRFEPFVPQKTRVRRALKSIPGLMRLTLRALNPLRWPRAARMMKRQL